MKTRLSVARSCFAILLVFQLFSTTRAAPVAPSAGSILQQVKPAAPTSVAPEARLTIERNRGDAVLPDSAPFPVRAIRIAGNTLFDTATLHALVAEAEGKTLTLAQLDERVARLTDYYNAHGYPLARAMILAQVMEAGVLVIDIVEARYGEITFNNTSRVNSSLLRDTLAALEPGQPIAEAGLNQALSALSGIPGVAVDATLKPGDAVGTSDLLVNTTRGPAYAGSVMLDNYGNRSTGKIRLSATVDVFNPLHHGDVLTASALSSGRGTNYARLAYESLVNGHGTRAGLSYSTLHYILGRPFAELNANGTARLKSFWVRTPLKRSQNFNLHGLVQYEALQLHDHIDAGGFQNDRQVRGGTVSVQGEVRDTFISNAITVWNVSWKTGRVAFDDAAAQLADTATADTQGTFSKWTLDVSRSQRLGAKSELYLSFAGQWGNDNLDSSEKIIAGGPYTVRAYDVGAVAGDSGSVLTAEFRRNLGFAVKTQWQAVAFVDYAQLKINHTRWVDAVNRVTLGGAGVGLNCTIAKDWRASSSVAARIGSVPELVTNAASARLWFEVSRRF